MLESLPVADKALFGISVNETTTNAHITPTPRIDDRAPDGEEEVKKGVQRMNSGKAAGATGIAVNHIKK